MYIMKTITSKPKILKTTASTIKPVEVPPPPSRSSLSPGICSLKVKDMVKTSQAVVIHKTIMIRCNTNTEQH